MGKKKSESETISVVEKYMSEQNRPYNSKMVIENLAGIYGKETFGKKAVEVALDTLAEKGLLQSKLHKKAKLFWFLQSNDQVPTPEELAKLDEQRDKLKLEETEWRENVNAVSGIISQLSSSLTDAEIESEIQRLEQENSHLSSHIASIKSADRPLITLEDKSKIEKKRSTYRVEWRKRKRKFAEISGTFEESIGPEFEKVKEDLGVETDSDAGVAFDQDHYTSFLKSQSAPTRS